MKRKTKGQEVPTEASRDQSLHSGKRGVRMEIRITILSHLDKNTRDFSITVGRKPRVK